MADDTYLTEAQVAEILGISPRTLQAWRYRGGHTPAFVKLGRTVRYRRSDLDAWIEERRRKSTSDSGPVEIHSTHRAGQ